MIEMNNYGILLKKRYKIRKNLYKKINYKRKNSMNIIIDVIVRISDSLNYAIN